MPKLKTHKGAKKRIAISGSGKLLRTKGGKSHLRRHTSKRTKAQLSEMHVVKAGKIIKRVKRLAPNME